jgi:hypothetical protein
LNNPILLNDPSGLSPDTSWKEMAPVHILSSPKPRTLNPGLVALNTPGTIFKSNPNYNPFAPKGTQNNSKYLTLQINPCLDGCIDPEHHDHETAKKIDMVLGEVVTAPIPLSKLKWAKWLFRGGKFMKYQKNFILNSAWKIWGKYMAKRGWTYTEIEKTLLHGKWSPISGNNYLNPGNSMSIVTSPSTGKSLIIDNVTKEVIHLGEKGYVY